MLIKLGSFFLTSKTIDKLHKISEILFFCGIILIFAFPLISEHTFIEEKQLKNTPLFSRDIDKDIFIESYREYLSVLNKTSNITNEILKFCLDVLMGKGNKSYNYIYTKEIMSPRGEKLKFIQINLIYDPNLENKESMLRANIIFYTILKFYSDQNNIPWLSRDIQFNYVTKKLFYEHPLECYDLLINGKYNKRVSFGQKISGIVNIDLTEFDIDNFQKFSLRFHGINSEQIDMDYYKMIYDNFISTFANAHKFITHDNILSQRAINNIKLFLKLPSFLFKKFLDPNLYTKYILYAIDNILSNFFMINNKINTNHLLVTKNKNSILMKIIPKNVTQNNMNTSVFDNSSDIFNQQKNNSKVEQTIDYTVLFRYRYIIGVFELIIKGISRDEIDLFRGQYFYILLDPKIFVGYYYLFILIFLVMKMFYELVSYINNHQKNNFEYFQNFNDNSVNINNKGIKGGRIIGGVLIISIISFVLFLHIEYIIKILKVENINAYYIVIIIMMLIQMIFLICLNPNREEENFINELLMFIMTLNCWNFIFINIGIGLFMSFIILPMEYIFLHLKSIKYNIIKIIILFIIIFSTLNTKQLLCSMLDNFLIYNNNVYIIISVSIFYVSLRMELFIFMIINNIKRGNVWYYDNDENDINKEIEDGNKLLNDDKDINKELEDVNNILNDDKNIKFKKD